MISILKDIFLFIFLIYFTEVQLIRNIVLISAVYTKVIQLYIYTLFFIFIPIIAYRRILSKLLYYTVGSCCSPILHIIVCICSSQTPNPSFPTSPPPWQHKSVLCVCDCFHFVDKLTCVLFQISHIMISYGIYLSLSDFSISYISKFPLDHLLRKKNIFSPSLQL